MKRLFIIAAMLFGTAHAAQQLVPQPFPVKDTSPCLVEIAPGVTVNGNMLIGITIDTVWVPGMFGDYKEAVLVHLPQLTKRYSIGEPRAVLEATYAQMVSKFKVCSTR